MMQIEVLDEIVTISPQTAALVEELFRTDEKAEIINGKVVRFMATGSAPGYAGDVIFVSLFNYSKQTRFGRAVGDNKAFVVDLPNRNSFSPDAAFHTGKITGMSFYDGAPVFAVEVRSKNDYGKTAERKMSEKRADYFAAGTLVVWDVDILGDDVIKSYSAENPNNPKIFKRGEIADAEPVLPAWTIAVDDLFDE